MNTIAKRRVFIVLGLYRPDPILLTRQLETLAAQTHKNFEVVACCDGPLEAECRAIIERFARLPMRVVGFGSHVGVHANFARGLHAAVAASQNDTDLFAFCDQDDVWHPDKLEREVAAFFDAETSLVHCDARIVSEGGDLLAPSLFQHEARSTAMSFLDLLVMNSVTGMTSVFRRDVAEAAMHFPLSRCRYILHDHWVALVASLLGSLRFISEPLVDYTQHRGNVMGAKGWRASWKRRAPHSRRRAQLLKCYRQFLWRRRALDALRQTLGRVARRNDDLFGSPLGALFDCESSRVAGLALSLVYRMRGRARQADQIYRIWRGKLLHCVTRRRRKAGERNFV